MKWERISITLESPDDVSEFENCLNCIHSSDKEEICQLRMCVHAFERLYERYVPRGENNGWPIKQERKTGKWIYDGTSFVSGFEWMHCSECNHADIWAEDTRTNYCPNCGAKMEGESE